MPVSPILRRDGAASAALPLLPARGRCAVAVIALLALLACLPAIASAGAPGAPPGPPPGNGVDLPPPPGTAPTVVPAGTAAVIPNGVTGPGRLGNSSVKLNKATRTFLLPLACQHNGTIQVNAISIARTPLARVPYTCSGNRTVARVKVTVKIAKALARRRIIAATAKVTEAGRAVKIFFTLRTDGGSDPTKDFWTDGHLQCTDSAGAPQAYLVEPDFTTQAPTPVTTRGWIAWYTDAGGWHWLGVNGENAGRWDTWTATPTGISQFHPGGVVTPVPWTWGPVTIPVGQGVTTVGVYEIVYWVNGKPDYQWQYVNAGTIGAAAAGGGTLGCSY